MRSQIVRSIQISDKGIPDLTSIKPGYPIFIEMYKDAYIFAVNSEFEKNSRLTISHKTLIPPEYGYIYYLVDPDQVELEKRKFVMVESGMTFTCEENECLFFLGTFQLLSIGRLTIHLFEILNTND